MARAGGLSRKGGASPPHPRPVPVWPALFLSDPVRLTPARSPCYSLLLTLATGGTGQSRITSVTFSSVGPFSVQLVWTAIVSATRFKVYYTTDGINFYPAPLPSGACTCLGRWRVPGFKERD